MSLAALLEAVLWAVKAQGSGFGSQREGSSGDLGVTTFLELISEGAEQGSGDWRRFFVCIF